MRRMHGRIDCIPLHRTVPCLHHDKRHDPGNIIRLTREQYHTENHQIINMHKEWKATKRSNHTVPPQPWAGQRFAIFIRFTAHRIISTQITKKQIWVFSSPSFIDLEIWLSGDSRPTRSPPLFNKLKTITQSYTARYCRKLSRSGKKEWLRLWLTMVHHETNELTQSFRANTINETSKRYIQLPGSLPLRSLILTLQLTSICIFPYIIHFTTSVQL